MLVHNMVHVGAYKNYYQLNTGISYQLGASDGFGQEKDGTHGGHIK